MVTTVMHQLYVWETAQRKIAKTFQISKKGAASTVVSSNFIGAVCSPKNPSQILLYGHTFLMVFNTSDSKAKRKPIASFQSLLFADYLADGTLVVVEQPWQKVIPQLPPAFHRKRFGT